MVAYWKRIADGLPRKLVSVLVLLLVVAALVLAVGRPEESVSYASPTLALNSPQQTNFQVLNKSATATANILVQFYDSAGNVVDAATFSDTIGPLQSKSYFQRNNPALPSGFRGSATVSSDQPIEVIETIVVHPSSPYYMSSSVSGITQGATMVYVPLVFCQYSSGWNTRLTVQNTDPSSNARVTIRYFTEAGIERTPTEVWIPPNASRTYDHGDMASQLGGTGFIGSAIVTSDRPVAVIIDEYSNYWGKLYSYCGIPESEKSTKLYVPLVAKKYGNDWYTNFMVRNVGESEANVRVTYYGQGLSSPLEVPYSITSSKMIYQILESSLPDGFVGTATLESDQPIVARVQFTQNRQFPSGGFNAFPSGKESTELLFPTMFKKCGADWYSSIYLMNTSTVTANVTITYFGGGLSSPVSRSYSVPKSLVIYQKLEPGLPDNWFGAAKITSDRPVLAVAAENTLPGVYNGDALMMYEGFRP